MFTKAILDDIRTIFESVCCDFEAELIEFDGEDDHVHLLVNYPPKVAISSLVNSLKGVSSRLACARKTTPASAKNYGAMPCGRRPTSPVAVAVRPSASYDSTSNNKKHRTDALRCKDGCAVRAIHPRPEGRGFAHNPDKLVSLKHHTTGILLCLNIESAS